MLVCGRCTGENVSTIMLEGTLEECRSLCRGAIPAKYESLNICHDNGVILWYLVKNGKQYIDYEKLIDE